MTVGSDDAVAGEDERERVAGQGGADGARGAWFTQPACDVLIGGDSAPRYAVQGAQHPQLELATLAQIQEFKRKPDWLTRQQAAQVGRDGIDLRARNAAGAGPARPG
jgi:hypothetical protein